MTAEPVPDAHADDALLRLAAGDHVGVEAERVQVSRRCPRCGGSDHGRPHAAVAERPEVWVSLARAGDLVVAAACTAPVGVDVEAIGRFPVPGFAEVALHARERATEARAQAVVWVRKEALLKALGTGLTTDPRAVRLSAPDEPPVLVSWHGGGPTPQVHLLDVGGEAHAACVAVLSPGADLPAVTLRWAARAAAPPRARPATAR